MARARNIKPGLYENEALAECSLAARWIFPGLWMLADRDGKLEDRPKKIKAKLLPYEDTDVEPLLTELANHGFIARYEAGGCKVILINNFTKHQSPHPREPVSELPDLETASPQPSQEMPGRAACAPEPSKEPAQLIPSSLIPDSLFSDSLIPESLSPSAVADDARAPEKPEPEKPEPPEEQKPDEPKPPPPPADPKPVYPEAFEVWWRSYPRKEGKALALKAWEAAAKRLAAVHGGRDAARDFLLERVKAYAATPAGNAGQYTPHPASWLNGGRYDDDPSMWQKRRDGPVAKGHLVGAGQTYDPEASKKDPNHGKW